MYSTGICNILKVTQQTSEEGIRMNEFSSVEYHFHQFLHFYRESGLERKALRCHRLINTFGLCTVLTTLSR